MTVAPRHRGPFWEEEVLGDILRSLDSRLFQEELRGSGRHGSMSVITVPDAGSLPDCPPLGIFAVDISTGDIYESVVDPDGIPCDTMWVPAAALPPWPGGGGGGGGVDWYQDPTPPTTGSNGELWYQPSTNTLYVLEAGTWVPVGGSVAPTVSYVHNQGVSSAVWTVTHNLGWYPNVTVIDSGGSTVEGDLAHLSVNSLRLTFSGAFTGIAYAS